MIPNHKYFNWLYYAHNQQLKINVGIGLFIWIFFTITLPFGMGNNNLKNHFEVLLLLLSFGLLWLVVSYLMDFIQKLLAPNKGWIVEGKSVNILIYKVLGFLHVILVYRGLLCHWSCISIMEYLELLFGGTLVFLLMYAPLSLYAKNLYYEKIAGTKRNEEAYSTFELRGAGKKPIRLSSKNVVYFKSDDNYVDISTIENGIKNRSP